MFKRPSVLDCCYCKSKKNEYYYNHNQCSSIEQQQKPDQQLVQCKVENENKQKTKIGYNSRLIGHELGAPRRHIHERTPG